MALYDKSYQQSGKSSWLDCDLNPDGAPMYLMQIQGPGTMCLQWFDLPAA
jgi:hypothetical protein